MYIFLILIFGFLLRLINIVKPEGLWNDEYVSWMVASTPFNEGFWSEVLKQCHLPLYYLYLKPFTGLSDTILRLASVLPSIISIYIMFLVGKEYSKKAGYICASLTAILPFLVYYSQEVRFYSLLFMFSALSLLFIIRILNNKKGWCGYFISSILILLTHVLGIIYVGFSTLYLIYKTKKNKLKIFISLGVIGLLLLPIGIHILKMLPSSQWWGNFSYTNILFLFSDYLSPILTNNINAPSVFFYKKELLFITLITIPTLIGFYAICKGFKQSKGIALIAIFTIITTTFLAITGKLVFITKYTIEILPIIILLFSLGIKNKFDKILLIIFAAITLFSILTPYYPAKILRSEGPKLVADIINNTETDKIIFTYYEPSRFLRYLNKKVEMQHISKTNRFEFVNSPTKILSNIERNQKISIVFLDSVSFIPDKYINEAKKKNIPEMFITFSIIKNELLKELDKNFGNHIIKQAGDWTVVTSTKLR